MAIKTIAVDSMVFIYHFDVIQPYFKKTSQILSEAQQKKSQIITSNVSVLEALSTPKYINHPEIIKEICLFFQEADYLTVIPVNWDITLEAARLRRENKYLRTPDAIQIATAIIHKADLFITHDAKLTKLNLPLNIISL